MPRTDLRRPAVTHWPHGSRRRPGRCSIGSRRVLLALADPRRWPPSCWSAGRVRVTAGRLDVVLRLGDLAIGVRMAGLDRPGWVPAAGRAINFHYD
ncbi:MAG: hypothetical protein HZY76_20390 [Anaerolineae bacterium]|nr:MAG: hypothetical protein HZY76_20390 [Anaerolineae bacterium]